MPDRIPAEVFPLAELLIDRSVESAERSAGLSMGIPGGLPVPNLPMERQLSRRGLATLDRGQDATRRNKLHESGQK